MATRAPLDRNILFKVINATIDRNYDYEQSCQIIRLCIVILHSKKFLDIQELRLLARDVGFYKEKIARKTMTVALTSGKNCNVEIRNYNKQGLGQEP